MERLTEIITDSFGKTRVVLSEPSKNSACADCIYTDECENCSLYKSVKKLNELEDIMGDTYNLDRLRELVEADKAGRCVVFPCKDWLELVFGDQETFYAIDDGYEEEKIREITVRNEERLMWFDGWKTVLFNGTDENGLDFEFSPENIGEDVFLTREEAEHALERMEGND